jgi:spore germination protein KA
VEELTHGCCLLLFDDACQGVSFEARSEIQRAVSEPTLEKSIKGARDAFVETLRVNTALVRRRLCTPRLKLLEAGVGSCSATRVAMLYLEGAAAPETVEALARRLDSLDAESLLATGILEERLTDAPRSPFPQLLHTERPDRFAQYLMEGRVGLFVDGLPIGLLGPVSFADFMRVSGDSSSSALIASALTGLRWLALGLSLLLPALYVAIALYHQEMIPTRLLLSVIEAKQRVPFSTALEVIGMLLSFELLQEAGLHLPNPIGDTVSIIGALIVGQSAVEARVVSPIAIIVVAFAGIAGYTLPSQDLGAAVRLLRMGLVLAATAAGLFGVGAALCLLLLHLAQIDSLGLNYTAPLSDGGARPLRRLLLRGPKREAETKITDGGREL